MNPPALSVERIGRESDGVLRNLFEHYLHDMAEWLRFETQADGRYGYDTTPIWEQDEHVYLARVGGALAGFGVVGTAARWLGDASVHDMREFFVLRRYRREGVGGALATALWNDHPGEWLVRVADVNVPALPFWRRTIAHYSQGAYQPEPRLFNERSWTFFRFRAP